MRVEENGRWQSSTGGQHSGLRAAAFSVRNAEEEVHVRVSAEGLAAARRAVAVVAGPSEAA